MTVLSNIFMRQTLTDDFWGLHKNMNCAFPLTNFFCVWEPSEYLRVSFFCFRDRSSHQRCSVKNVFSNFDKFHRKTPALEFLFYKVAGLLHHFEEHLWTASVANTISSQNFIIIRLKELKFYFATICIESCNLQLCHNWNQS